MSKTPENTARTRDSQGRWHKGVSGNAGGRPSTPLEVKQYIGAHTLEAARRLVAIMRGRDAQQARLAAEALLDRDLGRPRQDVDVVARKGVDPTTLVAGFDRMGAFLVDRLANLEPSDGEQPAASPSGLLPEVAPHGPAALAETAAPRSPEQGESEGDEP